MIIMSVFLERLSMWNMLSCAEQGQIQKYKTHAYNLIIRHSKQVSKQACWNFQLKQQQQQQQQNKTKNNKQIKQTNKQTNNNKPQIPYQSTCINNPNHSN